MQEFIQFQVTTDPLNGKDTVYGLGKDGKIYYLRVIVKDVIITKWEEVTNQ